MGIESDIQAAHIFTYIHSNPLDLIEPDWREGRVKNWADAKNFLKNYQWSSLGAYMGAKTDPLFHKLINRGFAENYYKDNAAHLSAIYEWGLRNYKEAENSYFLE